MDTIVRDGRGPGAARPGARRPPRRLGRRALLAATGAVLVAVPLTLLTVLVLGGSERLQAADQAVADALHDHVVARPALATALEVVSEITHPTVMRVLAGLLVVALWRHGRRRQAAWLAVATLVGSALSPLLKELVARARPVFPDPVAIAPGYSFPSGHALQSMLLAACVLVLAAPATRGRPALRAVLWTAATGLVVLTGFDRIALGVHYVSDVLAGWVVALATLCVTLAAFSGAPRTDAEVADLPAPPAAPGPHPPQEQQ
jgi:undecaprenyl-diphosphatase